MSKVTEFAASKGLTGRIFTRFFLTMVIFTMGIFFAFIGVAYILSQFTWHPTDWLYVVLGPIERNPLPFLLILWIIGFIMIFSYYWRKTLTFIDTIADASKLLVTNNDEYIHLPLELHQVEERMNQIKQESKRNAQLAKEAEQRKNDLIVYLAHDLKTPLTSVIGYLNLLKDEKEISEELRDKYLSISLEKAERLEDLINEFFEITRFNLSQLTLELGSVNLTRMIEQIAFEFNPLLADKHLSYSLDVDPNIEIQCDVQKMERVFDNLLRNAIHYSYENQTIEIIAKQEYDAVTIQFVNKGQNIPKEKLGRIFEQFYRLDTSRGTKTGGAGLGLAIAKEIIELHGGTIVANSEHETIEMKVTLPNAP